MDDGPPSLAKILRSRIEGLQAFGLTAVPVASPTAAHVLEPIVGRDKDLSGLSKEEELAELSQEVERCRGCSLYQSRTHAVVGDGTPHADIVFVGEAPGQDEDLQGKPFVGAAGQLLNKMIQAMGLKREDVYICNVLKDRPPGNRTPLPEEIEACFPFLYRQLRVIRPKVICVLGSVAVKALLGPHFSVMQIRGQVREYDGIPLVPTFHPAYLLRNPDAKKLAWQDLQVVMRLRQSGQKTDAS